MRIVIAGAGSVGTHLVKMFTDNNHDVVVIDNDKEKLQEISTHFDVMTIYGNSTSLNVQNEAEVSKSDLFISVSNYQETNILSCVIAKNLGTKKTIARIDNEEYLEGQNEQMLNNLGVDTLVYPEILASEDIARHLRYPKILKTISFALGHLFLFTLRISSDSDLKDKNLSDLNEKFGHILARVVVVQRSDKTIIPHGDDILREGDLVYILTDKEGRDKIMELLGVEKEGVKSVMILGGSKIGVKLAKKLEKEYYVKLFEKSRDKSFLIADELKETLVIHSEARDADFLMDEGISRTDAFIAVTNNSEINMLSCMLAKRLGVKKTFSEVENTDYLELIRNTDIDYVVNKKFIAASKIFTYSIDAEVVGMTYLTETEAEVYEFVIHENSKILKKPLKELDFPKEAIIGGILREDKTIIAVGETQMQPNDRVVVFSLAGQSEKIAKLFK
jgi:trk system potassium uptake protein TrkA